ncbi:MAG: hemolysin family protein [Planctomycetaceae bacterium]|jgi:putative hemolysin
MISAILFESLVIVLLFAANGLFAAAELSLISANRGRLKERADQNDRRAVTALRLIENPNHLLATIQVGITLVGTLAAAYGGAALARELEKLLVLLEWGWLTRLSGQLALGLVVLAITVGSILVGELIPKRIALHDPTRMALWVAPFVASLEVATRPVVWVLGKITESLTGLLGFGGLARPGTSLQDIRHLIEMGTAEGLVDPVEQRLAIEALQLGDRIVRQIMRPRIDIDAVDVATPPQELLGTISMAGFSRLPVYENDLDHIIGCVHLKDVLRQHYLGWQLDLRKLIRKAMFVPETLRLDQLLVRFQEERNQLAIVVDEFGATRGMVTLEDVLEELVGELLTEHHERVEQMIVPDDQGGWLVDGMVSLADLVERIGGAAQRANLPRNVSSVAGLVLDELGRLPLLGEQITWQGLRFEVVDLDGRRIDRLRVAKNLPTKSEPDKR